MSSRIHRYNSKDHNFDESDMRMGGMGEFKSHKNHIPSKPTKEEDALPFFDVEVVSVDVSSTKEAEKK